MVVEECCPVDVYGWLSDLVCAYVLAQRYGGLVCLYGQLMLLSTRIAVSTWMVLVSMDRSALLLGCDDVGGLGVWVICWV